MDHFHTNRLLGVLQMYVYKLCVGLGMDCSYVMHHSLSLTVMCA
jgi:hypothetical protein